MSLFKFRLLTISAAIIILVFRGNNAISDTRMIVTDFSSVFSKVDGLNEAADFRDNISGIPEYVLLDRIVVNSLIEGMGWSVTGPFSKFQIDTIMDSLNADIFFAGDFEQDDGFIYFTYFCFRNDSAGVSIGGRETWLFDKYDGLRDDLVKEVFDPKTETIFYGDDMKIVFHSELTEDETELFIEISKGRTATGAGAPFALDATDSSCIAQYSVDQFNARQLNVCGKNVDAGFVGGFGFSPSSMKFVFDDDAGRIIIGDVVTGESKLMHESQFKYEGMRGRPSPFFVNNHQFVCYGALGVGAWWLYDIGKKSKF